MHPILKSHTPILKSTSIYTHGKESPQVPQPASTQKQQEYASCTNSRIQVMRIQVILHRTHAFNSFYTARKKSTSIKCRWIRTSLWSLYEAHPYQRATAESSEWAFAVHCAGCRGRADASLERQSRCLSLSLRQSRCVDLYRPVLMCIVMECDGVVHGTASSLLHSASSLLHSASSTLHSASSLLLHPLHLLHIARHHIVKIISIRSYI